MQVLARLITLCIASWATREKLDCALFYEAYKLVLFALRLEYFWLTAET